MVVEKIEKLNELKKIIFDGNNPFFITAREKSWKRNMDYIEKKFYNRKRFNISFWTESGRFVRFYFNLKNGVYDWRYEYE